MSIRFVQSQTIGNRFKSLGEQSIQRTSTG